MKSWTVRKATILITVKQRERALATKCDFIANFNQDSSANEM